MENQPRTILTSLHICDEIDGVLHFIPCSVTENVAGYTPMGKPRNGMMGESTIDDPMPWYWGRTLGLITPSFCFMIHRYKFVAKQGVRCVSNYATNFQPKGS